MTDIPGMDELTDPAGGDKVHAIDVSAANDPKDRWMALSRLPGMADLAASATQRGLVELATTAEAQAGTDTARAVTPAGVAAYHQQPITIGVPGSVEGDVTLASLASVDWHIALGRATYYGHPNELMFIGYNRTGVSTYDDDTKPSIYIGFESDYYASEVLHYMEWYVEYRAGDGTGRRPYAFSINLDDHTIINQIFGSNRYYDSAGNLLMQTAEGNSVMSFYGAAIRGMVNDAYLLTQWNAANNAFYHIWLNSGNQWAIDAPITMYADILFNHSTNHGPVLIDRATAAQRRIICTNGVLSTEAA